MVWIAACLSFISGSLISVQGTINSQIGKGFSILAMIVSVSLVQGAIALVLLLPEARKGLLPLGVQNVWLAGIFGVLIMSGIAFSVARIGATTSMVLVIFGQLILAVFIDKFGLLGVEARVFTPERWISLGLITLGVVLLLLQTE